jgi:hypothetical protein
VPRQPKCRGRKIKLGLLEQPRCSEKPEIFYTLKMRKIANIIDFKIELYTSILFELEYEVVQLVRHSATK